MTVMMEIEQRADIPLYSFGGSFGLTAGTFRLSSGDSFICTLATGLANSAGFDPDGKTFTSLRG